MCARCPCECVDPDSARPIGPGCKPAMLWVCVLRGCACSGWCATLSEGHAVCVSGEAVPSKGVGGRAFLWESCCQARAPLDAHPSGGPARSRFLPEIHPGEGRRVRSTQPEPGACVGVGCATPAFSPRRRRWGGLFPGVGVGVGPGVGGEPMMSAAAAAAGPGRGRALGGPKPEPELEAGETRAAGGGHGDEPGLADAAPSQSGGPRANRAGPGRTGANSRAPSPLPGAAGARVASRARPLPFGVDLGAQGSWAEPGSAPRRARRCGETQGPRYGVRPSGSRGRCDRRGRGRGLLTPLLKG